MITHQSIGYSGRLGNQMFQYATLKAISFKKGYEFFLPNTLSIKHDGAFNFTDNKWIPYKLDLFDGFEINCPILDINLPLQYQEKDFIFDSEVFNIEDNVSIEGYFQSYKYFNELEEIFSFKKEILNKCTSIISSYSNPISVHIRRGDYVNHPGFWVVTLEYIQEALNQFTDGEYTFLVFSDDIEWCKQVFPEGVIFMEQNSQFEDLCLMSLCDHNIISNSTFSWWSAWLNKNPNKKVVAPKNWFATPKTLIDLYPKNWIII
jgi:hypothetical protein